MFLLAYCIWVSIVLHGSIYHTASGTKSMKEIKAILLEHAASFLLLTNDNDTLNDNQYWQRTSLKCDTSIFLGFEASPKLRTSQLNDVNTGIFNQKFLFNGLVSRCYSGKSRKRSDCNEGKMLNTTGGSSRMHVNTQIQLSLVCKTSRFRTLTGAWFTKQFLSLMSRDDDVRSLHDRSTGQPRRGHRTLFSSSRPQSQKGRPCRDIP